MQNDAARAWESTVGADLLGSNWGFMDLIQIVEYGLRANGYDGLFVECQCSCKVNDLAPCGCLTEGCCPSP